QAVLPRITEIEYHEDSARRSAPLLDRPWHVLLDSGRFGGEIGRFAVLAAAPHGTLTTRGDQTEIRTRRRGERSQPQPLALPAQLLGAPSPRPVEVRRHLPFAGGAIGYFAYDLGRRFERLPVIARDDVGVPDAAIGVCGWAVIVDHAGRRAWLVGAGRDERTFYEWDRLVERLSPAEAPERAIGGFAVTSSVRSSFDAESYRAAFERVKAHIRAGDCYQVNLTRRFDADV